MSALVAIAYDDPQTAEQVRGTLADLGEEELDDAVVVTRDDAGRVRLRRAVRPVATGASEVPVWGSLLGLIFLILKELGQQLAPGTSALFLLIRKSTPDKLLPRIEHFGGHVVRTSLSHEDEQRLRAALGD